MRITFETNLSKEKVSEALRNIHRLVLGSTPSKGLLYKHDDCLQVLDDIKDNQIEENDKNDWWLE